jgi:hypothetical protein
MPLICRALFEMMLKPDDKSLPIIISELQLLAEPISRREAVL